MALSIVNLNGDEILTLAALDSFYKECLLPVLDGVDALNLVPDYTKLRDFSLLKSILLQFKFCMYLIPFFFYYLCDNILARSSMPKLLNAKLLIQRHSFGVSVL